ncbi:Ubiquitin-like modifier-like protein [Hapsidospora chrysogenum ATCC 11550]|uniref:Ubiquitin-like modifier HUB1 n=1 Tax=Hapsidospora chrysogenum (strain ATCC 11550 / CBS 779.69 / DSM 880 / IAM 14645 / JCM 23072 / IMI 49137) TaxID=857340 RepID=A0A086THX4_HAPC1|nr:Ubiquitin-like modifier-like protein [Hapsidospora chrysogenum ATCC 11550]
MEDSGPRSRSRSPPRRAPKGGSRGFRWKDSRPNDSHDGRRDEGRSGEYRDRYRDRDGDRLRDDRPRNDRPRNDRPRDDRPRDDRPRDGRWRDDRRRSDRPRSPRRDRLEKKDKDSSEKPRKEKKAPAVPQTGLEMIVVNVNDRLGTKAAIPCLPSDTVGQLKLMVAARIGREPGQIMLKRQGLRPFKDFITLEDYGISNGVQLDLEIDTGD